MLTTELDQAKVEAFGESMLSVLNQGCLALMISIGHRTGLFDVMASGESGTSEEIAASAKLNERYVREWLGAMVTGKIILYDRNDKTYRLPPEHAASLSRAAGSENVAPFTQYIAVLGSVEDDIIRCFHHGGGVPYEKFHRFHEVMAEDSGQSVLSSLGDAILPLVPGLAARLETGINVLDVGCGSGRAIVWLAERYPKSRFTGFDLCDDAITAARTLANEKELGNVTFAALDVTHLDLADEFDLITAFDAIHDQANPPGVLQGIFNALRPGGTFLMQDIAASSCLENNLEHPIGPFIYTVSTMHCMTVSLAQGGMGLGTAWGIEKAMELLHEAGFKKVETHTLSHDFQNVYFVTQKPSA